MIEVFRQHLGQAKTVEEKLNRCRELLQLTALKILYDAGWLGRISFTGGTALRVLFDLKRFSEDLDFSLVEPKGYDFHELTGVLQKGFSLYGLNLTLKPSQKTNVHGVMLKFGGLLKEVGLSPLHSENLSVKLEIDTNPPRGGLVQTTIVNKVYMLGIVHFDLASLFATKLHACFYRRFTKGRDFYDLAWYLARKTLPNFTLLNNAIKQTQGEDPAISRETLREFLLSGIERIDFSAVRKDVERFLEDKNELRLLDADVFKSTIQSSY